MLAQKTLRLSSGNRTRYRFDTANLKIYFDTNIILFYFLIIFKSEPTPILSLVSALMGFLGPQDIIEYDYSF